MFLYSPSPEPPLLSTLRARGRFERRTLQSEDCTDEESTFLDQQAFRAPGFSAETTRAVNSPVYGSTSPRSSLTTSSSSLSHPSACSPSRQTLTTLNKYILGKYPGNPTNAWDKPWKTDKDILRQQSQIVQPVPTVAKLKRKREALVPMHSQSLQLPRLRRGAKHVIVDVPVGPDGKELDRGLINGKWKGPKMRKVVEVEVPEADLSSGNISNSPIPQPHTLLANFYTQPAQGLTEEPLPISCPFTMNRAYINKRSEKSMTHAKLSISPGPRPEVGAPPSPVAVPVVPKPTLDKSLLNRVKDADYETSDTVDDENIPARQRWKGSKDEVVLRHAQVKGSKTGSRTQPKRGQLPNLVSQGPLMVTWDPRTAIPVKHGTG